MDEFFLSRMDNTEYTMLSNLFIDEYMIDANGEYVKIYIYLLRFLNKGRLKLSFSDLSSKMDLTIKEIKRAMEYWSDKGWLKLQLDKGSEICGVILTGKNAASASNLQDACGDAEYKVDIRGAETGIMSNMANAPASYEDVTTSGSSYELYDEEHEAVSDFRADASNIKSISSFMSGRQVTALLEQDNIKKLMFVAQQYLGRTLSNTDIQALLFIYDRLHFGTELIEHLLAYCVSNKHSNMKYIEKVALDWASKGVTDIDGAKLAVNNYCKDYYDILKSLGINGRAANSEEIAYMKKWLKEWSFSVELIKKACEKTVVSANKPSFNYVNSILERWLASNVKSLEDIEALDEAFKNSKRKKRVSGSAFDFGQHDYDYKQIEIDLLSR